MLNLEQIKQLASLTLFYMGGGQIDPPLSIIER